MWTPTSYMTRAMSRQCTCRDIWSLIALLSVMTSYILICYQAAFDVRIRENVALIVISYVCDVIYLTDTISRIVIFRQISKKMKRMKKYKIISFVIDFLSLLPLETAVWLINYAVTVNGILLNDTITSTTTSTTTTTTTTRTVKPPGKFEVDVWNDSENIGRIFSHLNLNSRQFKKELGKRSTTGSNDLLDSQLFLTVFALLHLNRILRLYRIGAFYTGKTKELRLHVYWREIGSTLVSFICFLVILFHGIASLWYIKNCYPVWTNKPPVCQDPHLNDNNTGGIHFQSHPYYSHVDRTIADPFGWYVGALHWTVQSIRNSGNRYTPPEETKEMVMSSLIMLFGYFMCMVITVFSIYMLNEFDLRRSIFFHEAYAVKSFVKHFEMLRTVGDFSDACFNYMWKRKRGYSDHVMKQVLPKTVQTEIGMCVIQSMIDTSEILRCLPVDALESACLETKLKHFFPNEFLIRPNTTIHTAFFIVSGTVEILSDADGISPILTMDRGSLIGETTLIYSSIRKHGVKTRTPCDILMLNSHSVTRLLAEYPSSYTKIQSILKERAIWIKTKSKEREIEDAQEKLKDKDKDKEKEAETGTKTSTSIEKALEDKSSKTSSKNKDPSDETAEKIQTVDTDAPDAVPGDGDTLKNKNVAPDSKRGRIRRATGTQFMSVLAWLSFLKETKGASAGNEDSKYSKIYDDLQYKYRNAASVRMYKIIALEETPKYYWRKLVISKDCLFFQIWETFMMAMILLITFAYPWQLAFNVQVYCEPINWFADCLYIFDLILRLFIFYDPQEMSPIVASHWSHLVRELKNIIIIVDFIPIIPLYVFAIAFKMSYRNHNFLRMNINVKFVRVIMMFIHFENDVRVKIFTIRFFKNFFYITYFILCIACVFFMLGCPEYPSCHSNKEATWVPFSSKNSSHSQDNYLFIQGHDSVFLLSLFWAISTTYGIGLFDVDLKTRQETVTHSVGLLLGFCILTYFYADLASTLSGALENAIHHQDNVIWLTRYLDDALIDLRLIDRVTRYLDVQWQVLRGISSEAHRSIGFLTVSHSMYMELVVDYVADFLYRTHLFKYLDTDTMRKFCLASKLAVVPPNETIICTGDVIRRMYVIRRGYAQVFLGDSSTSIGILEPGNSFGEVNMIFGTPSQVTLRSLTYLEVIILDNSTFEKILETSKNFSEAITALRKDSIGISDFSQKFALQQLRQWKRKSRSGLPHPVHQGPENNSTFVYPKVLKNSKGEVVHLRKFPNDPYLKEFNKLGYGKFIRCFFMPLTFLPKGRCLKYWEFFRVCLIIITAIIVPLIEAFPNLKLTIEGYMYILDVFALGDMYIRAHTAYLDPETNDLVTHPLLTTRHYLTSSFLIDFLASLPVYTCIKWALISAKYESEVWAYLLKLNRLLLLYRVYGFYKFQDMKIVRGKNIWKMVKLLPLLVYHAHLLGCLLALGTCPTRRVQSNMKTRCFNDSWIARSNAPGNAGNNQNLTDLDIYVISFYYISTTSMGCGLGDFHPYNQSERILHSIIFYVYIFVRAYILANVVGSKCHMDHKLLGYQKQMNYLFGFLSREKLDIRLTQRIIRYYEYQWRRTQGIEPQKLFSNLFPSLRKEVAMDVFEDVMRQLPELKKVPNSFLRGICVYLTPIYFLRHDIIVQKNDVCDHIYFISRGRVVEWREQGEVYLEVGEYIGVMDISSLRPIYRYTASAVTNVDIFGIRRKDFARIVNMYPRIASRFARQRQQAAEATVIPPEDPTSVIIQPLQIPSFNENSTSPDPSISSEANMSIDNLEEPPSPRSTSQITVSTRSKAELGSNSSRGSHQGNLDNGLRQFRDLDRIVTLLIEEDKKQENRSVTGRGYAAAVLLDSKTFRYLSLCTFFAAYISTALVTYQWAFNSFKLRDKRNKLFKTDEYIIQGADYAVFSVAYLTDIIYIVRMGMSFSVSFFNDAGELVTEVSEIKNLYLSDPLGFGLDFFSTFPCEIFAGSAMIGKTNTETHTLAILWVSLRLNRLLRLIHVWLYYVKRSNSLSGSLMRTKLERIACFTLIYFHFLACILHGFSILSNPISSAECNKTDSQQKWACDEPERWYQTKNIVVENGTYFEDLGEGDKYVWSMYFVLSTFTTTAYGDILPVTYFERLLISFIAFSSMIWFGLCLSDILSGQENTIDSSYHLAAEIVLKLYHDYGVSPQINQKTIRYFTYAWAQNKGVVFPEFLIRAPACLKMDICTAVYGSHFRTGYLFRNLPEEFIRQATIRLHHFWVLEGDYVIRQNEIDSNLYFIHRGYVEYTKESIDEDERAVVDLGYLGKSSFFGEVQCLMGPEPHAYSYKAQVNLDVVSLTPADFQELFDIFPQHKATLIKRVMNRRKHNSKREKHRLGHDENPESDDTSRLVSQWNIRKMMLREMDQGVYDDD